METNICITEKQAKILYEVKEFIGNIAFNPDDDKYSKEDIERYEELEKIYSNYLKAKRNEN